MEDLLRSESFRPYCEAIRRISDGNQVYDLDKIRDECITRSRTDLGIYLDNGDFMSQIFTDNDLFISLIASYENRVLCGEDVREVYGVFNEERFKSPAVNMVLVRNVGKKCLAEFVESI